jgi:hypothetical protein
MKQPTSPDHRVLGRALATEISAEELVAAEAAGGTLPTADAGTNARTGGPSLHTLDIRVDDVPLPN